MTLAAAVAVLASALPAQGVLCGIDVLRAERFERLRGAKVGLITNHTGLDRDGGSTIDAFLAAEGVELVALFSPEHGLEGALDRKIADAVHEPSGLVVHSLYGESRKPTAESLRGVDTLVFDIQDIGCRFYTYVSTMGLAMEAAAQHGLRFVVLDRPDPIGGIAVDGPVRDDGLESFTAFHSIPVRHGMTIGELARMFAAERDLVVDLQVVAMKGWKREQLYDATGLYWTDPSPNMRSLTEALLYPGIGLLEVTNLSVGRGTDTPFEVLGAPWVNGRRLATALNDAGIPGVRCVPIRFSPTASVFAGQPCEGIRILVTDRSSFEPLGFGLHVACALHALFPDDWKTERYDKLLCDERTYRAVLAGQSPEEIRKLWRDELAGFMQRRAKYLMY